MLVPSLDYCARQENRNALQSTNVQFYLCFIRLVFLPDQITLLIFWFSATYSKRDVIQDWPVIPFGLRVCDMYIWICVLFCLPWQVMYRVPNYPGCCPHINKSIILSIEYQLEHHIATIARFNWTFIYKDLVGCAYVVGGWYNKYRLHSLMSV